MGSLPRFFCSRGTIDQLAAYENKTGLPTRLAGGESTEKAELQFLFEPRNCVRPYEACCSQNKKRSTDFLCALSGCWLRVMQFRFNSQQADRSYLAKSEN